MDVEPHAPGSGGVHHEREREQGELRHVHGAGASGVPSRLERDEKHADVDGGNGDELEESRPRIGRVAADGVGGPRPAEEVAKLDEVEGEVDRIEDDEGGKHGRHARRADAPARRRRARALTVDERDEERRRHERHEDEAGETDDVGPEVLAHPREDPLKVAAEDRVGTHEQGQHHAEHGAGRDDAEQGRPALARTSATGAHEGAKGMREVRELRAQEEADRGERA